MEIKINLISFKNQLKAQKLTSDFELKDSKDPKKGKFVIVKDEEGNFGTLPVTTKKDMSNTPSDQWILATDFGNCITKLG